MADGAGFQYGNSGGGGYYRPFFGYSDGGGNVDDYNDVFSQDNFDSGAGADWGWTPVDEGTIDNSLNNNIPLMDPSGGISVDVNSNSSPLDEGWIPTDSQIDYIGQPDQVTVDGGQINEVPLDTSNPAMDYTIPQVTSNPSLNLSDFLTQDTWNNPSAEFNKAMTQDEVAATGGVPNKSLGSKIVDDLTSILKGVGKVVGGVTGKSSGASGSPGAGSSGGLSLPQLPKQPTPTTTNPNKTPTTTPATKPATPVITATSSGLQIAGYSISYVMFAFGIVIVLLTFMIVLHRKGD